MAAGSCLLSACIIPNDAVASFEVVSSVSELTAATSTVVKSDCQIIAPSSKDHKEMYPASWITSTAVLL